MANPIELGLKDHEQKFVSALHGDPIYQRAFPEAFPGKIDAFTLSNVCKAIAALERTIISMRSPYDRYRWVMTPRRFPMRQGVGNLSSFPANARDAFNAMGVGTSAAVCGPKNPIHWGDSSTPA